MTMFPEPKVPNIPIVQVKLRNKYSETLTTWVDKRPTLLLGARVKLKDFKPDTWWIVEALYPQIHDAKDFDWHRKWDNNI